jgi:hypothetical protein
LTARPGESTTASIHRAPAGGYVAVSLGRWTFSGRGRGAEGWLFPRIAQHPSRTRVNDSYALRNEIPDELGARASVIVIPGASHTLVPEQPAAVVEAIVGWMRRLPR